MEDDKDVLAVGAEAVPVVGAGVAPTVGQGSHGRQGHVRRQGPHVEAVLRPPRELVPCC
jgi:hypothetical protein